MRRKAWKYTAGRRGHRVTVFEREPGGVLYEKVWDPTAASGGGGMRRASLGYRDRERAIQYAELQASKLRAGVEVIRAGRMTLDRLFRLYRAEVTPRKGSKEQKSDRRRAALWLGWLGADRDPHRITPAEWRGLIDARREGRISATGEPLPEDRRKPAGPRTVQVDCKWLKSVLKWGTEESDRDGHYLLRENPVRGYPIPAEKNPVQPMADQDHLEALLAAARKVTMEVRWNGKPRTVPSYLPDLLTITNGTGRRISPVCRLTFADLRLDQGPHGSIHWCAESDKMGRAWVAPMGPDVRAVIDRILRERPGIGAAPLFPAPGDVTVPVSYYYARKLLRLAIKEAKLTLPKRWGYHSFRRKFATEMKHMPDHDVAELGGWRNVNSLRLVYQKADHETMLEALLSRRELRGVRG